MIGQPCRMPATQYICMPTWLAYHTNKHHLIFRKEHELLFKSYQIDKNVQSPLILLFHFVKSTLYEVVNRLYNGTLLSYPQFL